MVTRYTRKLGAKIKKSLAEIIFFTENTTASDIVTVATKVKLNATAEDVWAFAGEWDKIDHLLGNITKVETTGNDVGSIRVISLHDGSKISQRMASKERTSYSYIITESPFPFSNFRSTIEVRNTRRGKCEFCWIATMKPKAASKESMERMILDVYGSGIETLKNKFS